MKKLMFFAVAAAGLLASCTSDDNFDANASLSQDLTADGRMPIEIGLGKIAAINTRGTGTVGDTVGGTNNVWQNQKVNIFMFKKNSLDLALIDEINNRTPIYDKAVFRTDVTGSDRNRAIDLTDAIKYYPTSGAFDFWGYRLDGAEDSIPAQTALNTYSHSTNQLAFGIKIDGSQDVMWAKAIPSAADSAALTENSVDHSDRAYSAYAARRAVQPELKFQHLLTCLHFQILAGTYDASALSANGIFVDSIGIETRTKGTFTVAYTPNAKPDSLIAWKSDRDTLYLKRRPTVGDASYDGAIPVENQNLVTLTPVAPQGTGTSQSDFVATPTEVGEALLVAHDTEYRLIVKMHQNVIVNEDGVTTREEHFTVPATLKLTEGFKPGHNYNVLITLYGLSKIEVTATLTAWSTGDTLEITPEDTLFDE